MTMALDCVINSEPIPGYRLLEPIGKGGYGEVWKCLAPGGLIKAIKIVPGTANMAVQTSSGAEQELQALERIKTIRHPFLLSMERVELVDGDLLIVTELADRSLHDLLCEYRKDGLAGIPRCDLIGYLREAAEVLDLMNHEYNLQHLDIKPRNIFLVGRHVKVADFGMVSSLAEMSGAAPHAIQLGAVTPLYARASWARSANPATNTAWPWRTANC
jgi:serine/threonine protein kinase